MQRNQLDCLCHHLLAHQCWRQWRGLPTPCRLIEYSRGAHHHWQPLKRETTPPMQLPRGPYSDVMMGAVASQITGISVVCLTVCSGTGQRKHQSSASLVLWGECTGHSPHKGPVTREVFPFDDVIMEECIVATLEPLNFQRSHAATTGGFGSCWTLYVLNNSVINDAKSTLWYAIFQNVKFEQF